MGDAALGMLATRMTLLDGMASSRIRKIAAELRPTEATQTRNPSVLIANGIGISDCVAQRDPGGWGHRAGGEDEERAAAMKANPMQIKPSPARAAVP
jgi:hypothetical protein